jgi:hypothetical protein
LQSTSSPKLHTVSKANEHPEHGSHPVYAGVDGIGMASLVNARKGISPINMMAI